MGARYFPDAHYCCLRENFGICANFFLLHNEKCSMMETIIKGSVLA